MALFAAQLQEEAADSKEEGEVVVVGGVVAARRTEAAGSREEEVAAALGVAEVQSSALLRSGRAVNRQEGVVQLVHSRGNGKDDSLDRLFASLVETAAVAPHCSHSIV